MQKPSFKPFVAFSSLWAGVLAVVVHHRTSDGPQGLFLDHQVSESLHSLAGDILPINELAGGLAERKTT